MVEHSSPEFEVCSVKFDRDSHAFSFFLLECIHVRVQEGITTQVSQDGKLGTGRAASDRDA